MTIVRSFFLKVLLILTIIIAAVWFAGNIGDYAVVADMVAQYGYFGLFLIAIISGFNLVVPVPAVALIPVVVAAGLNFWVALALVTVGMTIGDAFGIYLGRIGRDVVGEVGRFRTLDRVTAWMRRTKASPYVVAFLYAAFVPAPNELLIVPLSFLNVDANKLLGVVFVGNIVFNGLVAGGLVGLTYLL